MRFPVNLCLFLCCLIVISCSEQRSTPEDTSYVAAVVEYQVQSDVDTNIQNYIQLIQDAAEQNADVVVFPEMTLTRGSRAVPVPINGLLKDHPVPAENSNLYDEILVNISSAARQHQVYVVINIQEGMDCSNGDNGENCPESKLYLFNTNVVFDRAGAVIDRYRKINLFGEFTRNPALTPDLGVFTTDFGVTFGHFICFDLMFQVPSVQVVEKMNLKDIIFTTMWFSEMPYLTAVQIQQAYAYALNVNFIASGANNVGVGSAGSGIYSGRAGALVSTMPGQPTTRLLVSRVPKTPGEVTFDVPGPIYDPPTDHDSLVLISDPSLPSHISRPLVPGFQEFTLVDKEVTCRFRVRLEEREGSVSHRYLAFVHDGTNTYSRRRLGVASCLVVSCKNDDPKSCVHRFKESDADDAEIQELEIQMSTHRLQYNDTLKCENVVYYPSSLQTNKFPLNSKNLTFSEKRKRVQTQDVARKTNRELVIMKLNSPQRNLISVGIWGRIFMRDVDNNKDVSEEDIKSYTELENGIFGVTDNKHYQYRAVAFSGIRSFSGMATGGTRICAVVSCTGDDVSTCGSRFTQYADNSTAIFEEITVIATVPTPVTNLNLSTKDSTFYPISLDVSIMPLNPEDFSYIQEIGDDITTFNMTLNNVDKEVYSFAVWGRVFEWDGEDATPPSNNSALIHAIEKVLMFAIVTFIFVIME